MRSCSNARAETVVHFENRDVSSVRHNIAVYENEKATEAIFQGEIISGGTSVDYEFKAPAQGEYFFQCDVHPGMNGTVLVE
jgi:plastocyanin